MSTSAELVPQKRELAFRDNDGLEVGLYWLPADGSIEVDVVDSRTGESLRLPVRGSKEQELGKRALDAFAHPFSYAAAQGMYVERFDTRHAA